MASRSASMAFTQIALVAGRVQDLQTVFKFTGPEHSSAQGMLELHLKVESIRKTIPGGPGVVEHLMSTSWQPFDITGEWDDKWGNRSAGTPKVANFAFNTYRSFAQFVAKMPTVRFEIDELSLTGVITDLKIKYRDFTKIGWSVTFSPHTNSSAELAEAFKPAPSIPFPQWLLKAGDIYASLAGGLAIPQSLSLKTQILSTINSSLLAIQDGLSRAQDIVAGGLSGSGVNNTLLLIATTFGRVRSASLDMSIAVSQLTSADHVAYDDIIASVSFSQWWSEVFTDSMRMVGLANDAEEDARRRAGRNPKAIYYPKAGESLERISNMFYGTPNDWRLIYDASGLHGLVLDGTEELFIPQRRAA